MVHERLWAIKYILLLGLFGISLQSLGTAARYIEVEPFKTAITLHFQREWWYVLYAGGLLLIAAFNRKFYCKYLCALGAGLAIAGRFQIFDWLRRHRECGRPCQICTNECSSRAIRHNGEINQAECHYCLDCQVTYWHVYRCPPMVTRLKRREPDASILSKRFAGLDEHSVAVSPPQAPPSQRN
jgi:NosR/NirI family nitrous oxide reductase transcriptional regulator